MNWFVCICLLAVSLTSYDQTSDTQYAVPLSDVVAEIQERFDISIRDPENLIEGKFLTYAFWRFRPDLEQTLQNVFTPLDLIAHKEGDRKYKIKKYQYHLLSLDEGKEKLEWLGNLYTNQDEWENRKVILGRCILETLSLDNLPPAQENAPIISNKRKMNGYSIENIALETMPGLFVCASIYKPSEMKNKVPVILCPNGHFDGGRYRPDQQKRCSVLAQMGAIAVSYDLFAWGESLLQFKPDDHHTSLAMRIQALNSTLLLDYLLSLPEADPERVAITGGSGGGSQTMLISAIDPRIKLSVPVVALSCIHSGGCPCESGVPVHLCGDGTTNVEIAAMFAPKPQLIISDGEDWTAHVPKLEYPFLQRIYSFYKQTENLENKHFAQEGHDYGSAKRLAMFEFMAEHFDLDLHSMLDKDGNVDESECMIEKEEDMYVFGKEGELLPDHALRSMDELNKVIMDFKVKNEKE